VKSYADKGGLIPFLYSYIKDIISKVIAEQRVNIHDILDLEQDAERQAVEILPLALGKVRLPVFDANYYLKINTDVAKAYGSTNTIGAIWHWLEYGINEGRKSAPQFNVVQYLENYVDLKRAFGNNYFKAIDHYLIYGRKEERKPY
jgi:hypothetical protein